MIVYIAEKPSLAKAIFEGLGGNTQTGRKDGYFKKDSHVVTWCVGHLMELFDPEDYNTKYKKWEFDDLPIKTHWPPSLKPKKSTEKQFKIVLSLINNADSIVHAGDPDEEGQLLVDEILSFAGNCKPVKRLLIADLNLEPVKAALANMQPNEKFIGQGKSALARSLGDQSFGYNLTRGCTLKGQEKGFQGVLAVGRVQSAVLGLINMRTIANQTHIESYYYDIFCRIEVNGKMFKAKYIPEESEELNEDNRIISKQTATDIAQRTEGQPVQVSKKNVTPIQKSAPLPLNLSTLQQLCAQKFGYSASKTLSILQSLYEKHKLTTYPRTDNRYLSDSHFKDAEKILSAIKTTIPEMAHFTDGCDLSLKHKAFNAEKIEAHHAVIPTLKISSKSTLSSEEVKVYTLVAEGFIGLFYPNSIRNKTDIVFEIGGDKYSLSKSTMVMKGWEKIKSELNDGDKQERLATVDELSSLVVGSKGLTGGNEVIQRKTSPPPYFTESTLLKAMTSAARFIDDPKLRKDLEAKDEGSSDRGSIGTEATRASILEKLAANTALITIKKEKGYKENVWITTKQGQEFCRALPEEIVKPNISAIWAEKQAQIKNGTITVEEFINYVDNYIGKLIQSLASNGINITSNASTCPKCQAGRLRFIDGNNGKFWSCSNFPDCKATYKDRGGKPVLALPHPTIPKISIHKCPKCGKGMIRRIGRKYRGRQKFYWNCSGFPECKTMLFDKKGLPNYDSLKGET